MRGFQKGITLGVLHHISRIWAGGGWVVGGWVLLGLVSDHMTPSVIPFWNPLTKCYAFQQKKDFFFNIRRIFFFSFTIESAKSKSHLGGGFLHQIKNFFLAILFIYVLSTRIWSFTPQIEKQGILGLDNYTTLISVSVEYLMC